MSESHRGVGPAAARPSPPSGPALGSLPGLLVLSVLLFVTLVGLGLTLATFGARNWWWADLLTSFRVQMGLWLGVCGLLLAAARSNAAAALALAGGAFNLALVVPAYVPVTVHNAASARPLRVLLLNVHWENTDHAAVLSEIRKEQPDVAMFLETTPGWIAALGPLEDDYAQRVALPREDAFGMAIYSRLPLTSSVTQTLGSGAQPVMSVVVQTGGTTSITAVAAHPPPPFDPLHARQRDEYLHDMASFVRSQGAPAILCGDLNMTPWSPYFSDLTDGTGMLDASRGYGLQPTWDVDLPGILQVPLDHCLVSPEVGVRGVRRGPKVGSDHLPLIVDLAVLGR